MRLVGASNGFIRGPFMTEGLLEALIGSILAVIVLNVGMAIVLPRIQSSLQFLAFQMPIHTLLLTYLSLVVIGMLLGFFGSMIAMRRYLKV
jgi:cell division transport system permease protein